MDLSRTPLRTNIELKARLDRPDDALAVARRIGAADRGTTEQTDTYFSLGKYRLKLRESANGDNVLVGYSRPDTADAKKSQYRVERVENAGALKSFLGRQWGVKAIVKKSRHLFVWQERVRIHLDRVESLGDFLEFEAMVEAVPGYDEDAARLDIARLSHDFGITPRDLVAQSYSSMLTAAFSTPAGT
jgi:predicted adenylyl cyclase CyaB